MLNAFCPPSREIPVSFSMLILIQTFRCIDCQNRTDLIYRYRVDLDSRSIFDMSRLFCIGIVSNSIRVQYPISIFFLCIGIVSKSNIDRYPISFTKDVLESTSYKYNEIFFTSSAKIQAKKERLLLRLEKSGFRTRAGS